MSSHWCRDFVPGHTGRESARSHAGGAVNRRPVQDGGRNTAAGVASHTSAAPSAAEEMISSELFDMLKLYVFISVFLFIHFSWHCICSQCWKILLLLPLLPLSRADDHLATQKSLKTRAADCVHQTNYKLQARAHNHQFLSANYPLISYINCR